MLLADTNNTQFFVCLFFCNQCRHFLHIRGTVKKRGYAQLERIREYAQMNWGNISVYLSLTLAFSQIGLKDASQSEPGEDNSNGFGVRRFGKRRLGPIS